MKQRESTEDFKREVVRILATNGGSGIAKLPSHTHLATRRFMKLPFTLPSLKGNGHPREFIAYVVWAYHRFTLSTADDEGLLAEHGVIISR